LCLLHPAQTHQWSKRRGLRAKTDTLDATTIARVLLSGEARRGYVPSELVASYRELIRWHIHLADEAARYKNEIHALLQVLFPEYSQVFADPCRVTALSLLKRYPGARAVTTAGAETIARFLHELAPRNYGRRTAEQLLTLAQHSVSTHLADEARAKSLAILCDQLLHTQANLAQVGKDIEALIERDPHTKGIQALAEFGSITTAVLRAELGDVDRFGHTKQVVAYAGLDLEIKESGKWKGKAKLSKRGSGVLRRMLYLAAVRSVRLNSSPFGTYYHRLVERGLPKGAALIAVMRKMLIVAAHLIKTGEPYDPTKVGANYAASPRGEAA
jgi:transposase